VPDPEATPLDGHAMEIRSRKVVRLGPVRIDIRSNELDFKGLRFFSESFDPGSQDSSEAPPDFVLSLCNLNVDGPWPIKELALQRDTHYRAKRMANGYYLTDHFGAPAYLLTRGTHYWIFAEDFESILWPYAVKHLLTLYSVEHNLLHLKAAGIAVEGQGALLVGRGGSGKTVLLSQLCRAGAQFLSNTHVLMSGQNLLGIRTAMRVRPDRFFGPIIAARGLSPNVKAAEYTADPIRDLEWSSIRSAPVRSVCLVNYRGPEHCEIRELDRDVLLDYMEQFALAVNVYGLKEDLLDSLAADVTRFSEQMSQMKRQLRTVINQSRCYSLSCDAEDPNNLRTILDLLGSR
jgi:hypothetical protein